MPSSEHEVLRRPVSDRSAWRGSQLQGDASWIYSLSEAAIKDIDAVLPRVKDLELTSIRQHDFPLPSIVSELSAVLMELNNEIGRAHV